MPNHIATNLTITGPLDDVQRLRSNVGIKEDGSPDFNTLFPIPLVLLTISSPTAIVSDEEAAQDRRLERERDEAKKQAELGWQRAAEKDRAYGEALAQRDEARRELESLRRDKARLDWLERYHLSLSRLTTPDMSGIRFIGQCHNPAKERGKAGPSYLRIEGPTIRDAIDAAMQEGTP